MYQHGNLVSEKCYGMLRWALKHDDTHNTPLLAFKMQHRSSVCFLETGLYIAIPIDFEFIFAKINSLRSGT